MYPVDNLHTPHSVVAMPKRHSPATEKSPNCVRISADGRKRCVIADCKQSTQTADTRCHVGRAQDANSFTNPNWFHALWSAPQTDYVIKLIHDVAVASAAVSRPLQLIQQKINNQPTEYTHVYEGHQTIMTKATLTIPIRHRCPWPA